MFNDVILYSTYFFQENILMTPCMYVQVLNLKLPSRRPLCFLCPIFTSGKEKYCSLLSQLPYLGKFQSLVGLFFVNERETFWGFQRLRLHGWHEHYTRQELRNLQIFLVYFELVKENIGVRKKVYYTQW